MHGSRKARRLPNARLNTECTGVAFGKGNNSGLQSREATPIPAPPMDMRRPSVWVSLATDDAFARDQAREHAKAQLESITGRMFQVLNDYEDDAAVENSYGKGYLGDLGEQIGGIENSKLKNNIQLMIADYKDTCEEREQLLYSLADWFEEGHIDNLMEEAKHRKLSVAADPEGLRKSLLEGKRASERLKAINHQMEEAASQGIATDDLQEEKQQLEKELLKSMKMVDEINGVPHAPQEQGVSAAVTDSWKFAAVEICSMLHKVRDSGMADIHLLDQKIQDLVSSMNQQTEIIEQINSDLQQQKELVKFSELTTTKLSSDNSLLKEELEMTREQLIDAKKALASQKAQLQTLKMENELKEESERKPSAQKKAASREEEDQSRMTVEVYKAQIADLSRKAAALEKENLDLKESIQKELKDEQLKSKLGTSPQPPPDPSSPPLPSLSSPPPPPPSSSDQEGEAVVQPEREHSSDARSEREEGCELPRLPQLEQTSQGEANNFAGEEQSLLARVEDLEAARAEAQCLLQEKEQQLQEAWGEVEELREVIGRIEAELLELQRENTGMLRRQQEKAKCVCKQETDLLHTSLKKEAGLGHTEETHVQSNTNSTTLPPIVMETDSHMTSHDPSLHTPEEGSVWKLRGSAANGEEEEVELTAAEETAKEEHKNMETLDLVADLIQRVNENQAELADMDSKALKEVHFELQRVSEIVKGVLEYSTNLVSEEVDVMSSAADSLLTQLPEDTKLQLTKERTAPSVGSSTTHHNNNSNQVKLKEKVVKFADQAIEVLKAGEEVLTTKIHTQQKQLQSVVSAMAEHREKQPRAFKFSMPADVKGLVLEAQGVSTHYLSSKQSPSQQRPMKGERRKYFSRPFQHRFYSHMHTRAGRFFPLSQKLFGFQNHHHHLFNTQPYESHAPGLSGAMRGSNPLQINTTAHHAHSKGTKTAHNGTKNAGYSRGGSSSMPTRPFHEKAVTGVNPLQKQRKPKLYKPFNGTRNVRTLLQVNNYVPPQTAPAVGIKSAGVVGRGEGCGVEVRDVGRGGSMERSTAEARGRPVTTFFDLLNHSNSVAQQERDRRHHTMHDTIKLPPLT